MHVGPVLYRGVTPQAHPQPIIVLDLPVESLYLNSVCLVPVPLGFQIVNIPWL